MAINRGPTWAPTQTDDVTPVQFLSAAEILAGDYHLLEREQWYMKIIGTIPGGGGGGVSDIGGLTAAGFSAGHYPRWDGSAFIASSVYTQAEIDALIAGAKARANHTGTQAWNTLTGTPTTLAGYGITDAASDTELNTHTANVANPHSVTKAQVGLSNVTNVDHAAALAAHTGNTSNPHSVTKTQVGLGNVPNTDATARANHTGTQDWATITGEPTTLAGYGITDALDTSTVLDDLSGVNAPAPSNGDVLTWDSTPGEWVAAAPSGGGGATDIGALAAAGYAAGHFPQWDGASFEPVDVYTEAESDAKYALDTDLDAHTTSTANPHSVTKSQVGLALVTNADHAAALASHAALTNNPHAVTKTQVGLGNVTDVDHAAALASHTGNTSNPHSVTKTQVGLSNVPNTDATARANHTGTQLMATVSDAGNAATRNVGTAAGTVAHGDHLHSGVYAASGHAHVFNDLTDVNVGSANGGDIPVFDGADWNAAAHDHSADFAPLGHNHDPTPAALTDGATVTWNFNSLSAAVATLTIGGDRTLALSNVPANFAVGTLVVTQDGTGGWDLALPAGHKVVNSGAGVVALTAAPGSVDILMVQKVGSLYLWTIGKNYT